MGAHNRESAKKKIREARRIEKRIARDRARQHAGDRQPAAPAPVKEG
jgi:hypothetical protein